MQFREIQRELIDCYRWCYPMYDRRWITVYLSDAYKNGIEGRYDLTLDFYTYFDYWRFLDYRGALNEDSLILNADRLRLSTFFLVSAYKDETKYPRGHYILNLDVLAEEWHNEIEDKSIVNDNGTDRPDFFFARFAENKERIGHRSDLPLLIPTDTQV